MTQTTTSTHTNAHRPGDMRGPWRRAALVVAAGLVASALATPASAQYRQEGGRALDANTRAGSNGQNDAGSTGRGPLVTGNQIVTGNVTAGRQFRGATGYTDPSGFRGVTSGFVSDRFVRESAAAPRGAGGINTQVDLSRPQAFYGSDRAAPPPVGYVPTVGASGGYIAANSSVVSTDLRNRSLNLGVDSTARPGELILTTLDQARQQTLLSASPLYGVRVWENGTNPNAFNIPGQPGQPYQPGEGPMDRFGPNTNSILQMRDELNRSAGGQPGQGAGQGQPEGLAQPLNTSLNGADAGGGGTSTGTGQNQANALRANPLSTEIASTAIGGESGQTGQGNRYRLLVPADKQTPQLADLRRQYERRHGANATDQEANREFNIEMRAQQDAGKGKAKGGLNVQPPTGGAAGGRPLGGGSAPIPSTPAPATQEQPGSPDAAPSTPPAAGENASSPSGIPSGPVRIDSMAENVKAKGLHDLLASAEELMRQEKYAAALDKYNTAQDVAPNNRLITVGRAHAELAASYYRRAETDLREAWAQAPELTEASFDLKALVGSERLQVIVKDLKDLAESDKNQARPYLLLTYIAYHTGNAEQAAGYLDAAEKRTTGDDALLKAWRQGWRLPAVPTLNK